MNTWFTRLAVGALALATLDLTSCKKDESQVVLQPAAAPSLTASTTTPDLVLTTANAGTTGEVFTYTAADFGYQAVTSYTLQIDKKGGDFSSPQSFSGGGTAGTITLTKGQLVSALLNLGATPGAATQADVRVVASVGTAAPSQVSAVTTISGTPTPVCVPNVAGSWSIIGPAGDGWSSDRALNYDCYSQSFKLTTTLNAGEFKFRQNNAWTTNLGAGSGTLSKGATLKTGGDNLSIATAGTYTITLSVTTDASGNVSGGSATVK